MTVGEIVYKIRGDNSGIKSSLKDVENNANNSVQAIEQVSKSTNNLTGSTSQASKSIENVSSAVAAATKSVSELSNAGKQLGGCFEVDAEGNIIGISTAAHLAKINFDGLNDTVQNTNDKIKQTSQSTEEIGNTAEKSAVKSEQSFNSIGNAAGKAALTIAKIGLAATTAAATAVAALSKMAISGYGEYEQLAGGVETLFKGSAETVKNYADAAFKTAGLSANKYMSTVTSFSASLLQGLGGNTAAAAEIANQAIVDMSDNANKMGTDMSLIQNAYQGFAKQNYTMLDNLKLGYGGTQSEMARLINDSGVLGDTITITAQTINQVSFDKIIEAINVIQTRMGITGTTAKEAAATIQGSIAAMSGVWQNFLTGMADPTQDFDKLTNNLVESIMTVSDNLLPRIQVVLPQIAQGLTGIVTGILPRLPLAIEAVVPDVLKGANALVDALMTVLSSSVKTLAPITKDIAPEIINTLSNGISESVPAIAEAAFVIIPSLCEALLDAKNITALTQAAVDTVLALSQGLSDTMPVLLPAAVEAVITIAEGLIDNVDVMTETAFELIESLAEGVGASIPLLLQKAPVIIMQLASELSSIAPGIMLDVPIAICKGIVDGMLNYDWTDGAQSAASAIKSAFMNIFNLDNGNGGRNHGGGGTGGRRDDNIGLPESISEKSVELYEEQAKSHIKTIEEINAATNQRLEELGLVTPKIPEKTLTEEEIKALEKAEEERQAALKKATADKMQDLEILQLENGYSDGWLYSEMEKVISTLDKESELYKDYYQRILEGRQRLNDTAAKEQEKDREEQQAALKKELGEQQAAYAKQLDAIKSAKESIAAAAFDISDIFRSSESVDRRTGAKNRLLTTGSLEKRIEAQRKLIEQVEQLQARNVPAELIDELLKQDPEDAVIYARQLLNSPKKLDKLSGQITELKELSGELGNAAVQNQFQDLGRTAGSVFASAFKYTLLNESMFAGIFDESYMAKLAATINTSSAALSSSTVAAYAPSVTVETQQSGKKKEPAASTGGEVIKFVDLNFNYVAKGVKEADRRYKTTGGG